MLLPIAALVALLPTITVNSTDAFVDGDGCTLEHCTLPEALQILNGGKPDTIEFDLPDGQNVIALDSLSVSSSSIVMRARPETGLELRVDSGTSLTATGDVVVSGITFTVPTRQSHCLAITTGRGKVSVTEVGLGTEAQPCGSSFGAGALTVSGEASVGLSDLDIVTSTFGLMAFNARDVSVSDVRIDRSTVSGSGSTGLFVRATGDVRLAGVGIEGNFPFGRAVDVESGASALLEGVSVVDDFAIGIDNGMLAAIAVTAPAVAVTKVVIEGVGGNVGLEINSTTPAGLTQLAKVQLDGVVIGVPGEGGSDAAPTRGISIGRSAAASLTNIAIGNVGVTGIDLFNGGTLFIPGETATIADSTIGVVEGIAFPLGGTGISSSIGSRIRLERVVVANCNTGLNITADTLELDGVDIGVVVDGEAQGSTTGARLDVARSLSATDTFIAGNLGSGVQLHRAAIDTDLVVGVARDGSVVGNGLDFGVILVEGGVVPDGTDPRGLVPIFHGRVVGNGEDNGLLAIQSTVDGAVIGELGDGTAAGPGIGLFVSQSSDIRNVRVVNAGRFAASVASGTIRGGRFVDNAGGIVVGGSARLIDVDVGIDDDDRIAVNGDGAALLIDGGSASLIGGRYVGGGEDEAIVAVIGGSFNATGTAVGDVQHPVSSAFSFGSVGDGPPKKRRLAAAGAIERGVSKRSAFASLDGGSVCGVDVGVTVLSSNSSVAVGDIGLRDGVPCGVRRGVQVIDVDGDADASTTIELRGTIAAEEVAVAVEDVAGFVQLLASLRAPLPLDAPVGLLVDTVGVVNIEGAFAGRGALRFLDTRFDRFNVALALVGVAADAVVVAGCELPAFATLDGTVDGTGGRGVVVGEGSFMTPTPEQQTFLNIDLAVSETGGDGIVIDLVSDDDDDVLSMQLVADRSGRDGITVRGAVPEMKLGAIASGNRNDGVVIDTDRTIQLDGVFTGARLTPLFGSDFVRDISPLVGNGGNGLRCIGNSSAELLGVSSGNNVESGLRVQDDCAIFGIGGSQFGGLGNTRAPNGRGGIVVVDHGSVVGGDILTLEGDLAGLVGALGDALNCFVQHNRGNGITTIGADARFIPGPLLAVSDNTGLQIDIGGEGRTANDPDDVDGILNTPVITNVVADLIEVEIHGIVGQGQTVHLYRSKTREGAGQPLDHIASFTEGSDDDLDGGGVIGLGGFGAVTPATFVFRLPLTGIPAVALASDANRSSEPSEIFFLDPCLPSTLADGCDLDRDGLTNAEETAIGTNMFLADSDGDGLSDEQEGTGDSDGDGIIDAREHNSRDSDGDGLADFLDVEADDACAPDSSAGGCDSDGDGLTNAEEDFFGTDRTIADTDGDGIPDGFEAALDSDGDGLSNAVESSVGDVDNDGVPDQRDPVELAPECLTASDDQVLRETVVLDTDDDVRDFNASGVTCIVGNLLVGDAVTFLVLDALTVVTGRIVIGASVVENVELSVLVRAGTFELEENDSLVSVALPAIATIDGDLRVIGNDRLTLLDIRALRRVGGSVVITGNGSLGRLSAPELENVGDDLVIDDNDGLDVIDLPDLETVDGDLSIDGNGNLEEINLPGLSAIGGDLSITDNDSLTSIDASALGSIGGDLSITGNESVESIDLNALGAVGGDLTITDVGEGADVGLGNLQEVGGDVVVEGDAVLPEGWVCVDGLCAPACGDGIVIGDERCDDENALDGDGCSSICTIEPGYLCAVDGDGTSVCVGADALNQKPPAAVEGGCRSSGVPGSVLALLGGLIVASRRRVVRRQLSVKGRG